MMVDEEQAARWEDRMARLLVMAEGQEEGLSPLSAAILVALDLGLARDSRTFARVFDIAHALVLRECTMLIEDLGLLTIIRRDERTQRLFPALTEKGRALLGSAAGNPGAAITGQTSRLPL